MNDLIHPTAIIYPGAKVGENVKIGPYSIIGPYVEIDDGTDVRAHVVIEGHTKIGKNNRIFQFCSIGAEPQDYTYKGESTRVEIGDGNTFRENITVNCGTLKQDGVTIIGNNSLFMAYVHFGHDTVVEDNCTIGNSVNLAGHVSIGTKAIISGSSAVSQFISIGRGAFIGGCSAVDRDIPIFCTALGNKVRLKGVNIIGMKRQDYPREVISEVVDFLREMDASSLSPRAYVDSENIPEELLKNEIVMEMCDQIRTTKIGIAPFMS